MKTTKIAIASCIAVCGAAAAQETSVQVYGVVDVGLNYVSGLARGANDRAVMSGIMEGSRLGFKGSEDLGGGYRAFFTMESRMEANDGTFSNRPLSGSQLPDRLSQAALLGLPTPFQPVVDQISGVLSQSLGVNTAGRFWDRQIYVGLQTPVGAIMMGRMYTPGYEVAATYDTMYTQSSLSASQVATLPMGLDLRMSNAIQYRISHAGFTGSLMAAEADPGASGRFYGGQLRYDTDAWGAGVGYNTRDNEVDDKSLTNVVAGGYLRAGPGKVFVNYASIEDENPSGISTLPALITPAVGPTNAALIYDAYVSHLRQDAAVYHVGYRFERAQHTVYLSYSQLNDKRPDNADVQSYGLAYSYAFSKRTDVNLVLAHFNNKNLGQTAPGGNGFIGGVTERAGEDANNVALGLRHRF